MATIYSNTTTTIHEDSEGNLTAEVVESTSKVQRLTEPDFIKLYTNVWCEFNEIPVAWRPLFIELISRMTYCDAKDLKHSQIVQTGSIFGESIKQSLNIGQRQYLKGLKALTECNAIRKIGRGIYQINPSYAGRGEWKYNPKFQRGGVEALKATFNFVNKDVELDIKWTDEKSNMVAAELTINNKAPTKPIEAPTIDSNSSEGNNTPKATNAPTIDSNASTTNDMDLDGQITFDLNI